MALIGAKRFPVVNLENSIVDVRVSEVNPSLALCTLSVVGIVVLLVSHFNFSNQLVFIYRCIPLCICQQVNGTSWLGLRVVAVRLAGNLASWSLEDMGTAEDTAH